VPSRHLTIGNDDALKNRLDVTAPFCQQIENSLSDVDDGESGMVTGCSVRVLSRLCGPSVDDTVIMRCNVLMPWLGAEHHDSLPIA